MLENYYYVSEGVIVAFPELEKSKPIKSGYEFDKDCNYYIAKIDDFTKIEKYYNEGKSLENFFAYELVDSNVSLTYEDFFEEIDIELSLEIIKQHNGLLQVIEDSLGLTKERNVAYVLYKLCKKYNTSPFELIDLISD